MVPPPARRRWVPSCVFPAPAAPHRMARAPWDGQAAETFGQERTTLSLHEWSSSSSMSQIQHSEIVWEVQSCSYSGLRKPPLPQVDDVLLLGAPLSTLHSIPHKLVGRGRRVPIQKQWRSHASAQQCVLH